MQVHTDASGALASPHVSSEGAEGAASSMNTPWITCPPAELSHLSADPTRGCALQVRDKEGRLPMHVLAFQGHKDTLQVCMSGHCSAGETKFCCCEHVEIYFYTHFTQAIAKTDKALLEARCFNNATLVHHAAAGGQEEVILYLLEALGEDLLGELHKPCLPRNTNQNTRSHTFIRSSATRIRAQPSECANARNLEMCTLQRIDFCVHTTQRIHKCALTRRARARSTQMR